MYYKNSEGQILPFELPTNSMNELGGNTYTVRWNDRKGFYLEQTENFVIPSVLYGDVSTRANRIIKSFSLRTKNTGVLLTGEKGSGKTLLSKYVAEELRKQNVPTILVTSGFAGDAFNDFMMAIKEPCVVIIDEFEKIYNNQNGEQNALLTLLDGVVCGKKLYLLTCNDYNSINRAMIGRPGRILYAYEYHNLDQKFIVDYCDHNLKNKEYTESIIEIKQYYDINFDVLQAIVQECNLFDETPIQAMEHLNISKALGKLYFDPILRHNNKPVKIDTLVIIDPTFIHQKKTCHIDISEEIAKLYNFTYHQIYFQVKYDSTQQKYVTYNVYTYTEDKNDEDAEVKIDLLKNGWSFDLVHRDYTQSNLRWQS